MRLFVNFHVQLDCNVTAKLIGEFTSVLWISKKCVYSMENVWGMVGSCHCIFLMPYSVTHSLCPFGWWVLLFVFQVILAATGLALCLWHAARLNAGIFWRTFQYFPVLGACFGLQQPVLHKMQLWAWRCCTNTNELAFRPDWSGNFETFCSLLFIFTS